MDKTGIIAVSLCAVLLGVWFVENAKIAKQQAQYEQTNRVAQAQAQARQGGVNSNATVNAAAAVTVPVVFDTNQPEQILVLTNGRSRYTFTSRGGGLKQVELLDYPETVSARWQTKTGATNGLATLNTLAMVPALAVAGDPALVGDGNFTLTRTADGVRAEKTLTNGLQIIKEFRLTSNYLMQASVRFANTTDQPLFVPAQELVVGTATPMDAG